SSTISATRTRGEFSLRHIGVEVLKYVVLLLLSFSFILPLIWMVVSSIKNDSQVYTIPPIWIPNPALWQNFWNAWNTYNFNLYAFNTIVRFALPVTIGVTLSSAVVAYGFSRIRWKG